MDATQIKELTEITKAVSYLQGFIEGYSINSELCDESDFPFGAKNINDIYTIQEKFEKHHNSLVEKFKTNGNTNKNK